MNDDNNDMDDNTLPVESCPRCDKPDDDCSCLEEERHAIVAKLRQGEEEESPPSYNWTMSSGQQFEANKERWTKLVDTAAAALDEENNKEITEENEEEETDDRVRRLKELLETKKEDKEKIAWIDPAKRPFIQRTMSVIDPETGELKRKTVSFQGDTILSVEDAMDVLDRAVDNTTQKKEEEEMGECRHFSRYRESSISSVEDEDEDGSGESEWTEEEEDEEEESVDETERNREARRTHIAHILAEAEKTKIPLTYAMFTPPTPTMTTTTTNEHGDDIVEARDGDTDTDTSALLYQTTFYGKEQGAMQLCAKDGRKPFISNEKIALVAEQDGADVLRALIQCVQLTTNRVVMGNAMKTDPGGGESGLVGHFPQFDDDEDDDDDPPPPCSACAPHGLKECEECAFDDISPSPLVCAAHDAEGECEQCARDGETESEDKPEPPPCSVCAEAKRLVDERVAKLCSKHDNEEEEEDPRCFIGERPFFVQTIDEKVIADRLEKLKAYREMYEKKSMENRRHREFEHVFVPTSVGRQNFLKSFYRTGCSAIDVQDQEEDMEEKSANDGKRERDAGEKDDDDDDDDPVECVPRSSRRPEPTSGTSHKEEELDEQQFQMFDAVLTECSMQFSSKMARGEEEEEEQKEDAPADSAQRMAVLLDSIKGNSLEKFLEHNMPPYKDPSVLGAILARMLEDREAFGITRNIIVTTHSIVSRGYGSRIFDETAAFLQDTMGFIGTVMTLPDAYERFVASIRFILTQAYVYRRTETKEIKPEI